MRKQLRFLSRLVQLLVPAVVLIAQADHTNAFTGTWKLNVAKSKFSSGAAPQSTTVTIAPDGKFTMEGIDGDGKPMGWSHPWSGGKEVPVDGIENGTIISKVDGRVADDVLKVGGKTVETIHSVVSPGGKTATATIDGTDMQRRHMHSVQVYEKQ